MGEVSEMMLEGVLCQQCGTFVGDACGYPRWCHDCSPPPSLRIKVACPVCKRRVKHNGLSDHIRDAHKGDGV